MVLNAGNKSSRPEKEKEDGKESASTLKVNGNTAFAAGILILIQPKIIAVYL